MDEDSPVFQGKIRSVNVSTTLPTTASMLGMGATTRDSRTNPGQQVAERQNAARGQVRDPAELAALPEVPLQHVLHQATLGDHGQELLPDCRATSTTALAAGAAAMEEGAMTGQEIVGAGALYETTSTPVQSSSSKVSMMKGSPIDEGMDAKGSPRKKGSPKEKNSAKKSAKLTPPEGLLKHYLKDK